MGRKVWEQASWMNRVTGELNESSDGRVEWIDWQANWMNRVTGELNELTDGQKWTNWLTGKSGRIDWRAKVNELTDGQKWTNWLTGKSERIEWRASRTNWLTGKRGRIDWQAKARIEGQGWRRNQRQAKVTRWWVLVSEQRRWNSVTLDSPDGVGNLNSWVGLKVMKTQRRCRWIHEQAHHHQQGRI